MAENRIPCPQCGAEILEVTAKHNDGLCAPCFREKKSQELQRARDEKRRNAPPHPFDPESFSREEFEKALGKVIAAQGGEGDKICIEFLGFCEPVLFGRKSLWRGLKRIPRPWRELSAVYQAWGILSSDGFENYLDSTNRKFDKEVDRGLKLLNQPRACGVVSRARKAFEQNDEELPESVGDEIWRVLYDGMEDFEVSILGPCLNATVSSAKL